MFEVIEGGLRETAETSRKKLIAAYVTNTRLMGVVGVYASWFLPDNKLRDHLYQFFYLDAEEYGLDTYECVLGPDNEDTISRVEEIKNRLMGGLGGELVEIDEQELAYLVKEYAEINKKNGDLLPTDNDAFNYILTLDSNLSKERIDELMDKECEEITSKYQAVNYFLMRVFGKDLIAARYLTKGTFRINLFPDLPPSTLLRNEIDPVEQDYPKNFMCQSLLEVDDDYRLIISQVTVENQKVTGFEKVSDFKVSVPEANLMTQRGEYITVFEYDALPETFDRRATMLTEKAQITKYDSGNLFMIFKPNNEHVDQKIFRLNDDVLGTYFVTNAGEIILESYTEEGQKILEQDIIHGEIAMGLIPISKYFFSSPILFDFIQAGELMFDEFVEIVSNPEITD